MADIKECIGKRVKIGKTSITIKSENGKTCGVVRNISSLYDLQPNKQFQYCSKLRKLGLWGKIDIEECIISNNTIYVFRNIKSKLFHEEYGFFSEEEKAKEEREDLLYKTIQESNIDVIECIFV